MIKMDYGDDFEKRELTIQDELIEELPSKFKYIRTNKTVIIGNHYIRSLNNSPKCALELFSVFNNSSLESLKGLPKKIGYFIFSGSPKANHDLWRICESRIDSIWIGVDKIDIIDDKTCSSPNTELNDLCEQYRNVGRGRKMLEFQMCLIDLGYADD